MQAVINYVINRLQSIEGIAHVANCLPRVPNERELLSELGDTEGMLQTWTVENPRGQELLDQNTGRWDETLRIDGWYTYKDSSTQTQIQAWVDDIKLLFAGDMKLGKTVSGRSAMSMTLFQVDWLYDVLCHHVRFEMGVSRIHHA